MHEYRHPTIRTHTHAYRHPPIWTHMHEYRHPPIRTHTHAYRHPPIWMDMHAYRHPPIPPYGIPPYGCTRMHAAYEHICMHIGIPLWDAHVCILASPHTDAYTCITPCGACWCRSTCNQAADPPGGALSSTCLSARSGRPVMPIWCTRPWALSACRAGRVSDTICECGRRGQRGREDHGTRSTCAGRGGQALSCPVSTNIKTGLRGPGSWVVTPLAPAVGLRGPGSWVVAPLEGSNPPGPRQLKSHTHHTHL